MMMYITINHSVSKGKDGPFLSGNGLLCERGMTFSGDEFATKERYAIMLV